MEELLKLSDFFQPLNFHTLSIFVLLLIFFDSLGNWSKRCLLKLKTDKIRILDWLIGFGFFIFLWFILRFFIPPQKTAVLTTIIILSIISLPSYLKNKQYISLLKEMWKHKLALLIILPLLPAVFIKASLPPYYSDEMAYHFISPYSSININTWVFNGGLYSNLPQLLDTFMTLSFSLTKTYSIFRLFHFSILVTSMIFAYEILKKEFNVITAIIFVLIFFSLPINIVFTSTLGFVDVAGYSFTLIAWITGISFLLNQKKEALILSTLFWAMSLGTKYTAITAMISFLPPILLYVFYHKNKFKKFLNAKTLFKLILIFLIFGGYWYLKNLIRYGNPIYPFFFPCLKYASEWCGKASTFFSGWTTKITWANFRPIMNSIFPRNLFLQKIILITPIIILFNKNKKQKIISLWILASIIIEFILLKQISGFYARYHQHLELLIILLVAIQFSNKYTGQLKKLIIHGTFIILFCTLIFNYYLTVKHTNSLRFVTWSEINYSLGRTDIYDWINERFPRVSESIYWCESPSTGRKTALARFDPDMIWFEYDGFMRAYLTNCFYKNPPLEGLPLDQVKKIAKEKKMKFWTVSPNACLPDSEVKKHRDYESDHKIYLRKLNNIIVCNSTEVKPNFYYFNYEKL